MSYDWIRAWDLPNSLSMITEAAKIADFLPYSKLKTPSGDT